MMIYKEKKHQEFVDSGHDRLVNIQYLGEQIVSVREICKAAILAEKTNHKLRKRTFLATSFQPPILSLIILNFHL